GDGRDRQHPRPRGEIRNRAKSLPPADELRVLQPRGFAGAHGSDRHEGRRPAAEHARLHDCVGAARPRAVSARVESRRRHGVPLATQAGWNYRDASIGAPERLAGEIGSYIPFAKTRAEREKTHDPRLSIEERYRNRDEYVGKCAAAALQLVQRGYLLSEDVVD